jgi:hypothetical protein
MSFKDAAAGDISLPCASLHRARHDSDARPSPDCAQALLPHWAVRESLVSGGRGFIHGDDDAEVN